MNSYYELNCRKPARTKILGLHFEEAERGMLKYLNINTTYNSSIMWNYRQTESAFWSYYLPTVVGEMVATYPPTTEVTLIMPFSNSAIFQIILGSIHSKNNLS